MRRVAPEIQAGERYATQFGELWSGLSQTLVRLESIAGAPETLDDDETVDVLRRLQYRLHTAGQSVFALSPPVGAEPAHSELAAALQSARDATGEVVEAADAGGSRGVEAIVHEWRGALFRVRLARLRLTGARRPALPREPVPRFHAAGVASALTAGGAVAFAIGAIAGFWPIWVAGMIAVCISLLLYRP
jgi:hypothetical protein